MRHRDYHAAKIECVVLREEKAKAVMEAERGARSNAIKGRSNRERPQAGPIGQKTEASASGELAFGPDPVV